MRIKTITMLCLQPSRVWLDTCGDERPVRVGDVFDCVYAHLKVTAVTDCGFYLCESLPRTVPATRLGLLLGAT